jgi:hypothetical protein
VDQTGLYFRELNAVGVGLRIHKVNGQDWQEIVEEMLRREGYDFSAPEPVISQHCNT